MLPLIEASTGVDGKGSGDRLDPAADCARALAECDAMHAVEMANRPLRGQGRRDVGDAAQDALGAESGIEHVEMPQAVEHRQYCRSRSDCRPDGCDRLLEIIGLCRQQHGVENPVEGIGGRDPNGQPQIPHGAFDDEPALAECCGASRTNEKGYIRLGRRKATAKIPANRASPEHQKPRPG